MNISVLLPRLIANQGYGAHINTVRHAKGFFDIGHSVTLYACVTSVEEENINKIRSVHDFYGLPRGVSIVLSKSSTYDNAELSLLNSIKNSHSDLAYIRSFNAIPFLVHSKIATILETHTPCENNPDISRLKEIAKQPHFIGISTIHEKLKKNYIRQGIPANKVFVQEDAVDIENYNSILMDKSKLREMFNLPSDKNIILYLGSLIPGKGIPDLLDVASKIKNNNKIQFAIAGGPYIYAEKYRTYCHEKKIKNVFFLPYCYPSLTPFLIKSADCCIMLYNTKREKVSMFDRDTTSPLKLFEYAASKVPIVATDIPSIKKVLKHENNSLLASEGDIENICLNIMRVLNNKNDIIQIAENAYRMAKQNTYKLRCMNMIDIYKKIF